MTITLICVHCSATPAKMDIGAAEIDAWHKDRGFLRQHSPAGALSHIGYNKVIRRNGVIENGREEGELLAHAIGFNKNALAVCLVGGLDKDGAPEANFTKEQLASLHYQIGAWRLAHPQARICGHRDLPNVKKECPCFSVAHWLETGELIDPHKAS